MSKKIDYDKFDKLFSDFFVEIERTPPLLQPEEKRNWAVMNTELEKTYAYYKWFCENN